MVKKISSGYYGAVGILLLLYHAALQRKKLFIFILYIIAVVIEYDAKSIIKKNIPDSVIAQ